MVLKDCPRCLVYTPKGEHLAEARVVHGEDGVSLYFDTYNMNAAKFSTRIDFYDEQKGLIIALCNVILRKNPAFPDIPEPWMGECQILDVKNVVQRQQDIRARVHIEMLFHSGQHGTFYGIIENLSAGGFFLVTSQVLGKDEYITFNYAFLRALRTFEATTLRAKRMSDGKYGYGCCFLNLTDGADSAIRYYVYKVLMDKRKGNSKEQI